MDSNKSKSHIEYIVAATAVLISIMTLAVYIYQARIMAAQQHVSVWPYVSWDTNNVDGYQISVRNKGVGPAVIEAVEMRVNNQPVESATSIVKSVMGADTKINVINSYLLGRVLSPGESANIFYIRNPEDAKAFDQKFSKADLMFEITYCSIYGECWITEGTKAKRIHDMDLNIY